MPQSSCPDRHRGALQVPDGTVEFYAGKDVGSLIAQGLSVPDDYPSAFMRLTVRSDFLDNMNASGKRVRTVSFEVPDPTVEATVHFINQGSKQLETRRFHPGDPWVTGYAQVGWGPDQFLMGLFKVIKWNKDSSGTMPSAFGQEIHTTGLLEDPDLPTLTWGDDPRAAPLPPNWR